MTACSETDRAPSEFDLRELDKFRRLTEHKEIATACAMYYCAIQQICPPEWLVAASASLMIELLKREKTTRRGRNASYLARFRNEHWDSERWNAVQDVRRIREMAKSDDAVLKAYPNRGMSEVWKRRHKNRKQWLKAGTMESAAKLLEGRDAHLTGYGIRAAYRRVETARKDPSNAIGAWFDDAFLKKLGLQGVHDRKRGTKLPYFFDLP